MKKVILAILVLSLAAGFAAAEDIVLTVDQAVEMALGENLGLQQSEIALRTTEREKVNRWNAFLPSMSASAGFNGGAGIFQHQGVAPPTLTDAGAIGFTTGVALTLPIMFGTGSQMQQLVADYESGLLDFEAAQKSLERDVRKQFYYLLAVEQNITIREADLELAQNRLEQAQNNFANGLSPELEVLSAEVTVANTQPEIDRAIANFESLMLYFKFLIGAEYSDDVTLVGDINTTLHDDLDSTALINDFMPGRLDLRSLDKQIESLGYTRQMTNRMSNIPMLSVGYSWGLSGTNSDFDYTIPAAIDPWSDWNDRGTLSLTLSWSFDGLIPGSSTDVAIKSIDDGIETLELAKQMAWENAGSEITQLVNNLATAKKTIVGNTSSVELAKKNFELTQEAYEVGTRELLDVESAQKDYLAAAQLLLLAKYEYIAGLLDLEYALNAQMDEFIN